MKARIFPLFFATALVSTVVTASGQSAWDKGAATLNWGDSDNWNPDGVPLTTDDVTIASPITASDVIVLGTDRAINSLFFNHTATPLLLNSTTTRTLNLAGSNISGYNLQKQQGSTVTINANILLGDATVSGGITDLVWNNSNSSGGVNINGTIGKANPGQAVNLTKSGTGQIVVTATTAQHDATTVTGGTLRFNSGTIANVSFGSGDTTLDGGTFSYQGPEIAINTTTGLPTGNGGADRSLLSNLVTAGTGGTLNMNQGSGANAQAVAFNTITLGAPLSFTSPGGGNADGFTVAGQLTLLQDAARTLKITNSTGHNGNDWIAGPVVDGSGAAANPLRLLMSNRALQLSNPGNTYAGGTIIEAGGGSLFSYLDVTTAATLGTGNLTVQSGGRIRLNNPTDSVTAGNLAAGAAIQLDAGGAVGVNGAVGIADRFTAGSAGVYGIEGTRSHALDMSALGNGRMFLGTVTGGTFSGSLTAGADSTYRLGGGGSVANLTIPNLTNQLRINGVNVLTGSNHLVVGSGLNTNASAGRVLIAADQDFTGHITVNSDGLLATTVTGGTPFGNSANLIEVSGSFAATGVNGVFPSSAFSKTIFLPGSVLVLNNDNFNNTAGGNNNDRLDESLPVTLDGAGLSLQGARSSDTTETVGAVTFSGNSRLLISRANNSSQDVILTVGSLTRNPGATLAVVNTNSGMMAKFGADIDNQTNRLVATTPPALTNDMAPAHLVGYEQDGNGAAAAGSFLTYDPATGTNVPGTRGFKSATVVTNLNSAAATDIVTAAGTVLATSPSVHALKVTGSITKSGANTTVTIGSGGIIDQANGATHTAIFDSGSNEMILWKISGNQSNFEGLVTSGGLTKSGAATVNLTGAAHNISGGVTINQGQLNLASTFAAADLIDNLLTVNHEGIFNLQDNHVTIAGLSGSGKNGNVINSGGNPRTLTIDFAGGTQAYDGRLQATGTAANLALVKSGAGTQVFSPRSVASHGGDIQVLDGGLIVYGNFSAATGAVTVASGATLGGTGTLGGAVTTAGAIAPGASIGTLAVINHVTWTGAATPETATDWKFELGSGNTADKLAITGDFLKDASLGSAFRFDFQGSTATGTFTLAEWTGTTTFTAADFSATGLGGGNSGVFAIVGNQLRVTVSGGGLTPYQSWAAGSFAKPFTATDPAADPDRDGLKNLLEFVLGGDPTVSEPAVLPAVQSASGSNLILTFTRSDASELQPVAVKVQVSTDLATWSPADDIIIGAGPTGTGPNGASYTVNDSGVLDTVTVTIPKAAAARKFVRVMATE